MAASVRIEDEAFSDVRIEMLGSLAGYSRFEALGRMACLWRFCTQRQLYVVSEAAVNACIGPNGADHLVSVDLGERVEGGIRVRGTQGRIEWLEDLRQKRRAGGKARAGGATRDSAGRLSSTHPACAGEPSSTQPAQSSAPAPAPAPVKEEEECQAASPPTDSLGKSEPDSKPDRLSDRTRSIAETAVVEINRLTRRNYRADSQGVLDDARKLARNGYTPEQVKLVIQYKHRKWSTDEKMIQYLIPSTLLRLSKFRGYLDEAEANRPQSQSPPRQTTDDMPPMPLLNIGKENP